MFGEEVREKVFPEEEKEKKLLNKVRKILDLKFIIEKVKTHSSDSVANIHYQGFIETAKMFEPLILDRIVEGELWVQFREFYRRLHDLSNDEQSKTLSSIDILAKFLDPRFELYR